MSNTALAFSLSLISSKGGVGKSTIAINLSCALADMGLKVLCVDLDSQQSLSKFFKYEHEPETGILDFIIDENIYAVSTTHIPGVSIIVNNDYGEKLNEWMNEQFSGSFALKKMLTKLRPQYDVIIIDTQGRDGRGQAQEMALIASDAVIVPTTPDIISAQELPRSIDIYSQVINGLADMGLVTEQPPILRVLINRVDHTLETKEVTGQIRKHYSNLAKHISVLKTVIPQRVVWRNCISKQQPAHRYDTSSMLPAKEVIESVIHELMPHYSDLTLSVTGGKNE